MLICSKTLFCFHIVYGTPLPTMMGDVAQDGPTRAGASRPLVLNKNIQGSEANTLCRGKLSTRK